MSNNPKPPPGGWNKGRTFATQSAEAKKAFEDKAFESSIQALRFSFLAGRCTTLYAICDTLGLPQQKTPDCVVTREQLTGLILAARDYRNNPPLLQPIPDATPTPTVLKPEVVSPSAPEVRAEEPTPKSGGADTVHQTQVEAETPETEIPIDLPELEANPKVKPFGFQVRKTKELLHNFLHKKHRANVLLSQTGSGKTFMLGAMTKAMFRLKFFEGYNGMWPVLYVTKAPIVIQTEKVLEKQFGLTPRQVHVTNIEQLRSQLGKIFIHEETVVIQGAEHIIFKWRPRALPRLVIWDESQILMNIDSTQSKIAQALNDINEVSHGIEAEKVIQVFSSATPFMRLSHTKCFAVATRTRM